MKIPIFFLKLVLLTLLVLQEHQAISQDIYHPTYSETLGGFGLGIERLDLLPNGNLFVTGEFFSEFQLAETHLSSSGYTAYMAALSPAGDTLWYTELPGHPSRYTFNETADKLALTIKYINDFTYEGIYFPADEADNVALMQFDLNGNFEWAHSFHAGTFGVLGLENDAAGDIYMCGTYRDTVDLVGDTLLIAPALLSGYIAKFSSSGSGLLWVHNGDENVMVFQDITVNSNDEAIVLTHNSYGFDFQGIVAPGPVVIFKMNPAGTVVDLHSIPGSDAVVKNIQVSQSDGLYVTGHFTEDATHFDTVDIFPPYAGRLFAHYDPSFSLDWLKLAYTPNLASLTGSLKVAPDGSMLTNCYFHQAAYIEGRYSNELLQHSLVRISEAGETDWVAFQKYAHSGILSFCPDGEGHAWIASYTYDDSLGLGDLVLGTDFGGEVHFADLDYVSANGYRSAIGKVFLDDNGNGSFDLGEAPLETSVFSSDGVYLSLTNPSTGDYDLVLDSPAVSVMPVLPLYHFVATPSTGEHALPNGTTDTSGLDFAIQQVPGVNDLVVHSWSNQLVLGRPTLVYLQVENVGTTDQTDLELRLDFDSRLSLTAPSTAADSIAGTSLFWTVDTLPSLSSETMTVEFLVDHTTLALDDELKFFVEVNSLAVDTTPVNNVDSICGIVIASFDPNDKLVSVVDGNLTSQGTVPFDAESFEYTIRFQNTGTAPAYFVRIVDTLPSSLDQTTFRLIHATHNVTASIGAGNVLTFLFDPIFLPDSGADLAGSNGMVVFQIDRHPDLDFGTEISNKAHIYFDFNEPIETEPAILTMFSPSNAIDETELTTELHLFPNPSSGIVNLSTAYPLTTYPLRGILTDQLGRKVREVEILGPGVVSIDKLMDGYFLLQLQDPAGRLYSGSFLVNTK